MSWRFNPAEALSELPRPSAKVAKVAKVGGRNRAALAGLAGLAAPHGQDQKTTDYIPPLALDQCQEVQAWSPATQRLFVVILDHFEGKGFILTEAEALAYATVKELECRKGGPVGLLPAEFKEPLATVLDVFPGAKLISYGDN